MVTQRKKGRPKLKKNGTPDGFKKEIHKHVGVEEKMVLPRL